MPLVKVLHPPTLNVDGGCEMVPFGIVAACVGENEVVTQVQRVTRPRDEVVQVAFASDFLAAIKAFFALVLSQQFAIAFQRFAVDAK